MEQKSYRQSVDGVVGATLTPKPEKETLTASKYSRLSSLVSENKDLILLLETKLVSVTRPSVPISGTKEAKPKEILPPLPQALEELGDRVIQNNFILNDIVNRLEV